MGSTLQQGGLVLQLTLHKAATMELLSDNHNPRLAMKGKGLLAITQKRKEEDNVVVEEEEGEEEVEAEGDKKKKKKKKTKENKKENKVRLEMPLTVRLTESSHTFKFHVMLLSSDISGALIKIKVSPPNANAADPLCVVTRAFKSRARSNLHEVGSKRPRTDNSGYNDLGAGDDDGPPNFTSCGAGADEGPPPCFRSLGGDDDEVPLATGRGEDEGDAESEYEHEEENGDEARFLAQERGEAHALARARSQTFVDQAHAVDELQILLSALRTGGELPSRATLLRNLQRNSRH